jgi:hypothetical protein
MDNFQVLVQCTYMLLRCSDDVLNYFLFNGKVLFDLHFIIFNFSAYYDYYFVTFPTLYLIRHLFYILIISLFKI